jgi:hypothetical protein
VIRRLAAALIAVVVLTSGCGAALLGRRFPDCDPNDVTGEIIAQAQAVPTATVGACIHRLPPGWEYEHQEAESGRARFWLSSDQLGEPFATIEVVESCDPDGAIRRPAPAPGIEAFLRGNPSVEPVGLTILPLNADVVPYAASVGVALSAELVRGRPFDLILGNPRNPEDAVADALPAGRVVLTIGVGDVAAGTVGLKIPGEESEGGLTLQRAIAEIEEHVERPIYRATWYYRFEGGCITWEIDAEGGMVGDLDENMRRAIAFYDLAELRRQATEAGLYVGP